MKRVMVFINKYAGDELSSIMWHTKSKSNGKVDFVNIQNLVINAIDSWDIVKNNI